jgi:hypothetical protein
MREANVIAVNRNRAWRCIATVRDVTLPTAAARNVGRPPRRPIFGLKHYSRLFEFFFVIKLVRKRTPRSNAHARMTAEEKRERKRAADKAYYRKHHKKIRARSAQWYKDNKKKAKAYHRRRYLKRRPEYLARAKAQKETPEYKAYCKAFRQANRERLAAQKAQWAKAERGQTTTLLRVKVSRC